MLGFLDVGEHVMGMLDLHSVGPDGVEVRIEVGLKWAVAEARPSHQATAKMEVQRYRTLQGFGQISDYIRAHRLPHINTLFTGILELMVACCTVPPAELMVAPRPPKWLPAQVTCLGLPLVVVDVGAHLSDSCIWALGRFGTDTVRCLSMEALPELLRLGRRSLAANNFTPAAAVVGAAGGEVRVDCLFDPGACSHRAGRELAGARALLGPAGRVDVLKVHTNGNEVEVLRGAAALLRADKIRALVVCISETTDTVSGATRGGLEELEATLRDLAGDAFRVVPVGDHQALAVARSSILDPGWWLGTEAD
mmetsp:Transcript_66404/g.151975  ORF Transcript_66404/g.151975 Transcript_66404/m.151975 type:complete len:309 (+) Transcript_66404:933-1859(+)